MKLPAESDTNSMPIGFFTTFALSRGAVIQSRKPADIASITTNTSRTPITIKSFTRMRARRLSISIAILLFAGRLLESFFGVRMKAVTTCRTLKRTALSEGRRLRAAAEEIQNCPRRSIGSTRVADLFSYFLQFGAHRRVAIRFKQFQQLARE